MGVLDDAIREHLDLKRRRGASDEELARAEAEALGPARRAAPAAVEDEEAPDLAGDETLIVPPVDDVAPPPSLRGGDYDEPTRIDRGARQGPTRAVHDIDEDPLAPPAPVAGAEVHDIDEDPLGPPPLAGDIVDDPTARPGGDDGAPVDDAFVDEADVDEPPIDEPPIDGSAEDEPPIDGPAEDEPPIDKPPHEDPGGQRRF